MTPFTLATLAAPDGPRAALGLDGGYLPLDPTSTVRALLDRWDETRPALEERAAAARPDDLITDPHLLTPVRYPDTLLAVGANYRGHLEEMGLQATRWDPMPFFVRPARRCLVGPGDTVEAPRSSSRFDWECELAVVVGRPLRHADRAEAAAAIAGYTIGLDLTCRDLITVDNELGTDLARGKAQDTMAPCGPVIVPADVLGPVDDLRITLSVNDEPMMDASTAEMIYRVDEQLAVISEFLTLVPGDILFTGSPSGSAGEHGGRWLRPGDRIDARIGAIPTLSVSVHAS